MPTVQQTRVQTKPEHTKKTQQRGGEKCSDEELVCVFDLDSGSVLTVEVPGLTAVRETVTKFNQ